MKAAAATVLVFYAVSADAFSTGAGTCSTVPSDITGMSDSYRSNTGSYSFYTPEIIYRPGYNMGYLPGTAYNMELKSRDSDKINGMLAYVVKRGDDQASGTRVGTFVVGNETQLKIDCPAGSTITHTNGDDKDGFSFTWIAPPPVW